MNLYKTNLTLHKTNEYNFSKYYTEKSIQNLITLNKYNKYNKWITKYINDNNDNDNNNDNNNDNAIQNNQILINCLSFLYVSTFLFILTYKKANNFVFF